ncbi:hypothetical protein PG984_016090 [Apiospora sp. TS-2023a]
MSAPGQSSTPNLAPPPPPPTPAAPGASPAAPLELSDSGSDDGGGGTTAAPAVQQVITSTNNPEQDLKLGLVLCSKADKYRHITSVPDDVSAFKLPTPGAVGNIDSVHSLQEEMTSWLTSNALLTATASLVEQLLPESVRDHVYVGNWDQEEHFQFAAGSADEQRHEALIDQIQVDANTGRIRGTRQLNAVRAKPWSILTVNVDGNHWVTVLVGLNPNVRLGATPPNHHYGRVERLSIIEGLYQQNGRQDGGGDESESAIRKKIYARLESLLEAAGLTFAGEEPADWRRSIWAPAQTDGTSCGVRAYAHIKTLLHRLARIGDAYDTPFIQISPAAPECQSVFEPMPGWFHYEHERWEMVSRNAAAAVRACGYQARVAVEILQETRGGVEAKDALRLSDQRPQYVAWPAAERRKLARRRKRGAAAAAAAEKRDPPPPKTPENNSPSPSPSPSPELEYYKPGRERPDFRKTPVVLVMQPPTVRKGGKYVDILPAPLEYYSGSGSGNTLRNNNENPFAERQRGPTGVIMRVRKKPAAASGEEPPRKKVKTMTTATTGNKGGKKKSTIPPLETTPAQPGGGRGTRKVPPRKPMRPAT